MTRTASTSARAVVVHHRGHVAAALAAAATHRTEAVLVSPPGFALYAGPAYFREMIEQGAAAAPQARFEAILDCGDRPGAALAALRDGVARVAVTVPNTARARLEHLAGRYGARLVKRPRGALDLAAEDDPHAACESWFSVVTARSRKAARRSLPKL